MEGILKLSFLLVIFSYLHGLRASPDLKDLKGSWIIKKKPIHRNVEGEQHHAKFTGANFVMSRNVQHEEEEYRVFHDGILGTEMTTKRAGERGLYYRLVTDGKKLIKLVYAGRRGLVDCEVDRNKEDIDKFIAEFLQNDLTTLTDMRRRNRPIDVNALLGKSHILARNTSYRLMNDRVLHEPYSTIADINSMKKECIQLHHNIKHNLKNRGVDVDLFENVDVKTGSVGASPKLIPRRVKRVRRSNAETAHKRSRRGLLMPDTKWCGAGSDTSTFEDVGQSRDTDRCCREHDHCPYFIEGFSSRYNYFNFNFHTLSHCYCDEVFRTCLKSSGSSNSNMVGRLFFNILGMECFEFETQEVCVDRSWWGSCRRYEEQVVATVRGSLTWE